MKSSAAILFFLMVTFTHNASAQAQDKPKISTNPPPMAMSLPVLKEIGKAKASYNERADNTIVGTSPVQVAGDFRNGVRLRAGYISKGKRITKPDSITLTFYTSAQDRTYADNRAVLINLDGKVVLSETAKYENGNTNGEVFAISVTQSISYEMFVKLLAAKTVQMKIGPTEFELKESGMEALKDLKKLIDQAE